MVIISECPNCKDETLVKSINKKFCWNCGAEYTLDGKLMNGDENMDALDAFLAKGGEPIKLADEIAKDDDEKLKLSLVPSQIIRDIAEIRMYGNRKYGSPDNWKKVEMRRYVDALYRHFLAFVDDPYSVDEESGFPHIKHIACNVAFICEMMKGDKKHGRTDEMAF